MRAKLIILSPRTFFPHQNEFKDPIPRADFSVKRNSKYAVAVVLLRHGFIFALHEKGILHRFSSSYLACPFSRANFSIKFISRCSILLFYSNFSS